MRQGINDRTKDRGGSHHNRSCRFLNFRSKAIAVKAIAAVPRSRTARSSPIWIGDQHHYLVRVALDCQQCQGAALKGEPFHRVFSSPR
jgi:hypothetical protein